MDLPPSLRAMPRHHLADAIVGPIDQSWRLRSACRGMDPELFFPSPGGDNSATKAICLTCPVRLQCLDHAIVHNEPGIWGGTSHSERRSLRRARRSVA